MICKDDIIDIFCSALEKNDIKFYTGVPDSYLNDFCNYLLNKNEGEHIIAANEGNAVAIATGYHLANGSIPLVYMQNSGLGNAVNPLASLVDVYNIPMLLLIGWRGEPGSNDWVQHECQGRITTKILDDLHINFDVLKNYTDIDTIVDKAVKNIKLHNQPYAIVVSKGVFSNNKKNDVANRYPLSRKDAIDVIIDCFDKDTIYIASTGRITRELYYAKRNKEDAVDTSFLNLGAMGHTSSIGLGIAVAKSDRQIVVLDGDSANIMHMGAMTTVNKYNVPNYLHIVLNNESHESVGGQPSAGEIVNFCEIAKTCGYDTLKMPVRTKDELINECLRQKNRKMAGFIEVKIDKGLREKLPPLEFSRSSIKKIKDDFMRGMK